MTGGAGQEQEATITSIPDGDVVTCLFRPKEYTFSKTNSWTPGKVVGSEMEKPKFNGGQPKTVKLELIFDTWEAKTDVRDKTGKLWKMMKISPQKTEPSTKVGEPPYVEFRWGEFWTFRAVITSITEKFTLFAPEGEPRRSVVSLDLLQAEMEENWPGQNPTSGGRENYAVHIVKEGETIDWIAFVEYGNSNAWRELAAGNRLDDPSRLRPGQRLLVVPLD
jgi:nucleoid-associated protein YgaU